MVMGAGKSNTIQKFPILQWYFTQFREMLTAGDTKIMVIGHGFGDQHINDELVAASKNHDLAMYLVDPAGLRPFDPPPNQLVGRMIRFPEFRFIGVATRPFRDAFWDDELQYSSLMRFFDN